ncbi:unnamed protein product [Bursaphelenchus okinawaensis]|uniref:SH2 domain-containing protein n=1 Tax=Bursaphelenchus okinawaensis TaxID=465554 RepID=A0A811LER9_9BILA|nr:unnamed protein product [Bursaphelenchus okinawaensis]CAG9121693.1 unnamed protein product [Bursaphelenchus okinawaensis]
MTKTFKFYSKFIRSFCFHRDQSIFDIRFQNFWFWHLNTASMTSPGRSYFEDGSGYDLTMSDSEEYQQAPPTRHRPDGVCITCCEHGQLCRLGTENDDKLRIEAIDSSTAESYEPVILQRERQAFSLLNMGAQEQQKKYNVSTTPTNMMKNKPHLEPLYYDDDDYENYYLGHITQQEAMENCPERTQFKVYHKVSDVKDLDELEPCLRMFVVYHTSKGGYCHFPINSLKSEKQKYYYVECGDPDPPRFADIESIVRFYTVYVQLHYSNEMQQVDPDVFPWWNLPEDQIIYLNNTS